jgi:threonylcarbamoyladenosine tRNA methylthiotransferase MtaB
MLALAKEGTREFNQHFRGRARPVLWEKRTNGLWSGYTDNYIKVYIKSQHDLANQIMPVRLGEISGDGVWGFSRRAEPVPAPL